MKRFIVGLFLALGVSIAYAQTPVFTNPSSRSSVNTASTTITNTGTFQSVFIQNTARNGCTLQNKGSNAMSVYFGPIANATTGKSVSVAAGTSVYCTAFGTVLTDQVSVTGVSGDSFYAAQY